MQTLHFFSLLLLSKLSEAAIILPTGIPNVLPDNVVPNPQTTTAPRLNARQNVGVTSMWSEFKTSIGDANAYLGTIYATDIQYLTMGKAPTTTWIQKNTNYVAIQGTKTIEAVVATATTASNGQSVGDISIILPEGLANSLKKSAIAAIDACDGFKKRQIRRDDPSNGYLSCILQFAYAAASKNGPIDSFIHGPALENANLKLADNAPYILTGFVNALTSVREKQNSILWFMTLAVVLQRGYALSDLSQVVSIGKLTMPRLGFGFGGQGSKGCTGTEEVTAKSPQCEASDCKGESSGVCTVAGAKSKCRCVPLIPSTSGTEVADQSFMNFQSEWFLNVTNGNIEGGTSSGKAGQSIALASYIHPLADMGAWDKMLSYPNDKVSLLVANVINGPGAIVQKDWEGVIARANSKGKRIIGYVRTGYLGASWQKFETRLGSTDLADWTMQIQQDVDLWYSLYPGMIGGIFLDEGWNDCGPNNQYAELYRLISETIKRKYPGAYTVLNPGSPMPQCFENSADTLMTFENSYEAYTSPTFSDVDWVPKDPRKFWHIIHTTPADKVAEVAALAWKRHVGLVHITDDIMPNPYDTVPQESYMQALMNSVSGGELIVAEPLPSSANSGQASQSGGIVIEAFDYSSVKLSWKYGGSTPYAWALYLNGKELGRLQGSMIQTTVGNLPTGSSGLTFTIYGIGSDGTASKASQSVTGKTLSLPGGTTVDNVKVSSTATTITYEADVLIPYGFLRVFITDPDNNCVLPAWPIPYNKGGRICAHYVVEADTLYTYNSPMIDEATTNWGWNWKQQGEWANVKIDRNVYHYKWTLPVGTSTVNPNYFVIQAEGYGPLTNVIGPCPDRWKKNPPNAGASCTGNLPYDCQGATLCSTTLVKWCDKAVNNMQRGSKIYESNGISLAVSGNCWANYEQFGCKVYVQGTDQDGNNCRVTGDELWQAYQDIRGAGGCSTCGSKHFGNGCLVSVDYHYGCDNRDTGPRLVRDMIAGNITEAL